MPRVAHRTSRRFTAWAATSWMMYALGATTVGISFHPAVDAVVIVGLSVIVSLLVLWTVRRVVPHEKLKPHNDVSGFVYAAIAVLYAVVLGFAVISVWEQYREAESNANQEANAVGNIYRLAAGLPEPSRQVMQQSALSYATAVIEDEWPSLVRGDGPSALAASSLDQLWLSFHEAEFTTPKESAVYAQGLEQLDRLAGLRRERLVQAEGGLLGIMWGVLFGGAALTVFFPCAFGVESRLVHSLVIATLAATLGLLLFLTYDLNHPFRGDVHVQPDGFIRVLEQFRQARESFLAPLLF